jgi:hypothetical protein
MTARQSSGTLYAEDFYLWTQQQTALLRTGKWQELDCENLAEEIESVGRSEKLELGNRLEVLLTHLLQWQYQPEGRRKGHSWEDTIWEQRRQLVALLQDSPSLRHEVTPRLAQHYPAAWRKARRDTQVPDATFPATCPWNVEQMLDEEFWPEGSAGS